MKVILLQCPHENKITWSLEFLRHVNKVTSAKFSDLSTTTNQRKARMWHDE